MTTRRVIIVGTAVVAGAVGALVAVPGSRHAIRHLVAQHTHVRFGRSIATSVVPVPEAMPAVAAREADLRFASRALAEEGGAPLVPPRLEAAAFGPPTAVTVAPGSTAAATVAGLDRTTEPTHTAPPTDTDFSGDLAGARQALLRYHDGDVAGGDDFARPLSGVLRTALDWAAIRLQSRQAGASRLQGFVVDHPQWPLRSWIDRRLEETRAAAIHDPLALQAIFTTGQPQTLGGTLSLARARLATGDNAGAASLVQATWRATDLTGPEQAEILHDFGSLLRKEDHKTRADRFLYKENVAEALKAAILAGPDVVLLTRARAAVIASAPSDTAIAAVPKPLQSDPGLLFARIQKARRAGRIDEATALMQTAPREAAALVDGDAWWVERRLLARKLLDVGNPKLAYAIASGDCAASPAMKIEAAFHAGWIALRFLNDPTLAAPHFAAVSTLAETPISNARGAYWQGRTAEAQGHADEATAFFQQAADLPTTFYGQLAAAKLGRSAPPLRHPLAPALGTARAEAVRCVGLLFALGERDLAVSLALAIAKTDPDEAQVAALASVVEATGDARATLIVGKAAAQRGMPLDDAAFPTFGIPGYQPIEHSADRATVLAIARQESEFDPRSVSSAGAMGLMQLIASTARRTAQDAGIGFDETRLLTDAAFNARIGAAHLGKLLSDLDGSYILTFAAYNAGPRNVQNWMALYGDPRKPGIDPVDWIERIPFTETRNYVQRVFENMQIYRTQFGMPTAVLTASRPAGPGKGT